MNLKNKVIWITGASSGIGKSLSIELSKLDTKLILSSRNFETLTEVKQLCSNSDNVEILPLDLQEYSNMEEKVTKAISIFGKIDILVNNAGITIDGLLMRMKDEDWDTVINVNLTACMRLTRQVLRGMLKRRYGRIIFISSIVGYTGNAGQSNYSASKSGLIGLSKSLAAEVASRGITCNLVAPGFISTPMTDKLTEDQKNNIIKNIPVDRLGSPQDISAACVYLASEESSFITGTTLHVNGGMAML